jgi:DNA mismatch repair protein MutS2
MKHARRVLEFDAVLVLLVSRCETAMGMAEAERLEPSDEPDVVWAGLETTRQALGLISERGCPSLVPVRDLREAAKRAGKGGTLGGQELAQIAYALLAMRETRAFVSTRRDRYPALWAHAEILPDLKRLEDTLKTSLEPDGEVRDAASPRLTELRRKRQTTTSRIQERIQSYVSGRTRELLSDPIYTVRDGRYVIPLKAENRGKIKGIVHDTSGSGQTIYLEPEDVLQLGNALREAEAAEREEVQRVLAELSAKVGGAADEIIEGIRAAGHLDFLTAKAVLAQDMKATIPLRSQGHGIIIERGRHPLLDPETAVPLDLTVGFGSSGLLITGPNTGGKTVAIKTVGLFVLMAQSGLAVPAREVRLGPFTQVWADIGDEQSLQQSLSTFSGHIKNIAEALRELRPGALALFDEIGAGTDPAEGAALAKAILRRLRDQGATVVASTHYGELKAFAYQEEGFQNAAMEFDSKTLRPTYRLLMGAPGASHALKIAERYGLPKSVVEDAVAGLSGQEQEVGRMMEKLDQAQRQARIAQGEADRRLAELRKAEERAAQKLAEADEIRRTVNARSSAAVEAALREIRLEAAAIFEDLKQSTDAKSLQRARERLKELQEVGSSFAQDLQPKEAKPQAAPRELKKGMSVKIEGYTQVGTLLDDPKGNTAQVQMGPLKITVKTSQLVPVQEAAPAQKVKPRANIGLQKAQTLSREIHLRAMRAEDAEKELDRFMDDALLAGMSQVRIVHGKGTGVLRKLTQDYLRRHPAVDSFREGEPAEGGHGVTIALLK